MKLPKAKEKVVREFFQMRVKAKVKAWIIARATERDMSYGEFIEEIFEPVMEKEKCPKKKPNSTQK